MQNKTWPQFDSSLFANYLYFQQLEIIITTLPGSLHTPTQDTTLDFGPIMVSTTDTLLTKNLYQWTNLSLPPEVNMIIGIQQETLPTSSENTTKDHISESLPVNSIDIITMMF